MTAMITSVQCMKCRTLVRLPQPTSVDEVPRGDDGRYVVPAHTCIVTAPLPREPVADDVHRAPCAWSAAEPEPVEVHLAPCATPSWLLDGRTRWTAPVAGEYHIGHGEPHLTSTCGDWCEPKAPVTVHTKRVPLLSDDEMNELVQRVGLGLRKGGWL